MITKEQLQVMSDFEVNKALASLVMLVLKKETWTFNDNKNTVQFFNEVTKKSMVVDYCNTPNDIMPLAFEYAIGVEVNPLRTEWLARTCDISMSNMNFRCYVDKNPLRAMACCLILVLQEKQK